MKEEISKLRRHRAREKRVNKRKMRRMKKMRKAKMKRQINLRKKKKRKRIMSKTKVSKQQRKPQYWRSWPTSSRSQPRNS